MADDGALRERLLETAIALDTDNRALIPVNGQMSVLLRQAILALDSTVPASDGGATNPEVVEGRDDPLGELLGNLVPESVRIAAEGLRLLDAYVREEPQPPDFEDITVGPLLRWCEVHLRPILAAAAGEQVGP